MQPPLEIPGNRDVAPEAVLFHAHAEEFGLPLPFERLPYNIVQLGQTPDDPLGVSATRPLNNQGFGTSTFSYLDYYVTDQNGSTSINSLYDGTFQVHPGLDYGNGNPDWTMRVVVSICDGVVIQGREQAANGRDGGGTANPGRGVSIRCFLEPLAEAPIDENGNRVPQLSNIIVVYNHLLWAPVSAGEAAYIILAHGPYFIDCQFAIVNCTPDEPYELPRFRYPGAGDTIVVDAVREGDVVYAGTVLGQTGAGEVDHLHLEIWIARGYLKATQADINSTEINRSLVINPFLMYRSPILPQHVLQGYYPTEIYSYLGSVPEDGHFGLDADDLTQWSLGGLDFSLNVDGTGFYSVQTTNTPGPEWSNGIYPLVTATPLTISDLIGFMLDHYTTNPYVPIDCPVTIESTPNSLPQTREIATCVMPDLQDHD
jgi:hypothetical protein